MKKLAHTFVLLLAMYVSGCGYLLNGFQGGTRLIKPGAREWGDLAPGYKLICIKDQNEDVIEYRGGRLFSPFSMALSGEPKSIHGGEELTVKKLYIYKTGSYQAYKLDLLDQQGLSVRIAVSTGASFTRAYFARIGFRIDPENQR